MSKDWVTEFNMINKNLYNLNKRNRVAKQIKKDPAAYFAAHSDTKRLIKPKVQFCLPDIAK